MMIIKEKKDIPKTEHYAVLEYTTYSSSNTSSYIAFDNEAEAKEYVKSKLNNTNKFSLLYVSPIEIKVTMEFIYSKPDDTNKV